MENLSKKLRNKLSEKDVAIFKLTLWTCLFTWIVMFLIFSVTMAIYSAGVIRDHMEGLDGDILYYLVPIWIIFTALLTVAFVMKFTNKKLRPKVEEREEYEGSDE